LGGIPVQQILKDIHGKKLEKQAISENMPRLRTIQFILNYFEVKEI